MSFTLTIDLVNESGDALTRKDQTRTSARFETPPPDALSATDGRGSATVVGGSSFETQVWYGHGQAASRGAAISVSDGRVSTVPSNADVEVESADGQAATVKVIFGD
ncbi:hypothetical protein SAMN06265365_116100 [Tistlia consotensis]|uniref:Uncharacterized protein n=1 Tax=Tistlia consotensis USBA 355 TaxID=560819 RepID=A0A1Y6C6H2_9PROT|nr:hypothetical protein [Tistlia consotensis]SMF48039.1 hypothetical protein SAMN05428998_11737 [Tistlia consotensis USBA 355]SNR81943.1 hypothetical protein SAMN06265365_116100 [Tistlia consotensis]